MSQWINDGSVLMVDPMEVSVKCIEQERNRSMNYLTIRKAMALVVAGVFLAVFTVNADNYTVTNSNDSGAGTLRDIVTGTTIADGDTVDFDAGVTHITLTGAYITINDDISILGPGVDNLTIDGGGNDRIFYMDSTVLKVVIANLTMTNGSVDATTSGGCIYMGTSGSMELTVSNCVINACTSGDNGGGISAREGAFTLINTEITDCVANDRGGAAYVESGVDVLIKGCTIANNASTNAGGGLYIDSNELTARIQDTVIASNSTAATAGGDGGGLWFGGVYELDGCIISDNSANDYGGGLYANVNSLLLTSSVVNCTFSNNYAVGFGGGFLNYRNGHVNISNTTFVINRAANRGGAIYGDGSTDLVNLNIYDSVFSGNVATNHGGALYIVDEFVSLIRCTLSGNKVLAGGGDGGAIVIGGDESYLEIDSCTLSGNVAVDDGGAIYTTDPGLIYNSTISGNSTGDDGGGIMFSGAVTETQKVYNCTIYDNTAAGNGGGIRMNQGVMELYSSIISQNTSSDTDGALAVMDHCLADNVLSSGTPSGSGYITGNPNLLSLADNGGTTFTHALQKGSIAYWGGG